MNQVPAITDQVNEQLLISAVGMRDAIYKDSTPKLHVGSSSFEDWFQAQPFATQVGIKQMCRDSYAAGMGDPLVTYASSQAQPEPVAMHSSTDPAKAKLTYAEPHAELKAIYAQQVKDGTLGDFVWELRLKNGDFTTCLNYGRPCAPQWLKYGVYRCVPKPTCQVRNLDTGELKTMTREAAKKLQAEFGDTVEWVSPQGLVINDSLDHPFGFSCEGIYTYKLKGTVKLTIDDEPSKMLTPAQCEAERLARIDTHDVESRSNFEHCQIFEKDDTANWFAFDFNGAEYRLIRKQPKQSWTGSREDVIALLKEKGLL